jgi:glycerol-3-phosphate dehydrogenase (NAD(P)+)
MSDTVAILGAGAWGTALAVHLAGVAAPPALRLWARDPAAARAIAASRENSRYLPGIAIPSEIDVDFELLHAIAGASLIIVATPIGALTDIVQALRAQTKAPLAWLGKGFVAAAEPPGVALAHRVIAPMWRAPVGVISGPSFAEEVARGLPTAISVAATDPDLAQSIAQRLRGDTLRAYVSDDLTGTEVGGAVKNVLAIAAGASDGLGFGNNARAALITRGLAETARLAVALGGMRETLTGLSGLGDLVLTCTGDLSRNRRVGLGLGRGEALAPILVALGHVAEGVSAARAVHMLAAALRVNMPICEAVYQVLYEDLTPRRAVEALLAREPGPEFQ